MTFIKRDCTNCFDNVTMEYRYTQDGLDAYVCQECGVYCYVEVIE